jgi:N-acetylglucosaminyldiphosphoundecaprenol N-acetyl-beta-D-mannosaminyltransferase
VALLGAQPDVNEAAVKNLKQTYPGLTIVYAHHGFFASAEERAQIAQACADARPNYVFVALGVPHQERWIQEFKAIFQEPTVFVGVGGSFDIWSGLKQRAHPLFLKWHLEWLYRITSEPFRIKRVYKTLPTFALKVLFQDSRSASS